MSQHMVTIITRSYKEFCDQNIEIDIHYGYRSHVLSDRLDITTGLVAVYRVKFQNEMDMLTFALKHSEWLHREG